MPQNNKPGRRLLRQLYGSWYRVRHNISIFARWCLFAVIIGVVVGAVGAAFEHALEWATEAELDTVFSAAGRCFHCVLVQ